MVPGVSRGAEGMCAFGQWSCPRPTGLVVFPGAVRVRKKRSSLVAYLGIL